MCEDNATSVNEIFLQGFKNLYNYKIVFFLFVLLIFIAILVGNLLIIVSVSVSQQLRRPMYFFLKNLAIADVLLTSNVLPALLHVILWGGGHISLTGCILQYYLHTFLLIAQLYILTVMSYDRYLAICYPLHYAAIINTKNCLYFVSVSWIFSCFLISSELIVIVQMEFCGSNVVDHFFCDIDEILQISTSYNFILLWEDLVVALLSIFFPFLLIVASYICIFFTIFKISSMSGRKKAFSTCSSHLLVVCVYYGMLIAIYIVPSGKNAQNDNKLKSLIYIVLTPLINPIVYSLRNREMIESIKTLMYKYVQAEKCWRV
ncbi:olfactory receptor 1M1-like [Dendropsophus ebraccatus]|uniref:olfactory receptor 1M1-like n=1 Tax=Dendropsophus ebraccatus TaxID=150705 RepID=UPI003831CEC0